MTKAPFTKPLTAWTSSFHFKWCWEKHSVPPGTTASLTWISTVKPSLSINFRPNNFGRNTLPASRAKPSKSGPSTQSITLICPKDQHCPSELRTPSALLVQSGRTSSWEHFVSFSHGETLSLEISAGFGKAKWLASCTWCYRAPRFTSRGSKGRQGSVSSHAAGRSGECNQQLQVNI